MYLNSTRLIGNLTADPVLKALPSGIKVATFTIATNESYTKDGKKVEKTEFHNVVVFGGQAENCAKYLVKGSQVFIDGKNQTRSWEDKETKKKMYRTEVIAGRVQFGAKPKVEEPKKVEEDDEATNFDDLDINPDDIPF